MTTPRFPTRIEARAGREMSPDEIFEVANRREKSLAHLLLHLSQPGSRLCCCREHFWAFGT